MKAPHGFHVFEGSLYRDGNYSAPIRENYSRHCGTIDTVSDFSSTIRAGKYAWPGGYTFYFFTSDGAVLSYDSAVENFRIIADSIRSKTDDGWRVVGIGCTCDDDEIPCCEHSGKPVDE